MNKKKEHVTEGNRKESDKEKAALNKRENDSRDRAGDALTQKKYESDLTPKEKRDLERKKIKEMTIGQKIGYIVEYYKIVFAALLAIVVILYIGLTIFQNAQKKTLLSIAVVDGGLDLDNNTIRLENDLLEFLGTGDKKEEILVDTNALSGSGVAAVMKMTVVMSDGVTDVLLCNQQIYDEYKGDAVFKDWKDVLGESYGQYERYIVDGAISLQDSSRWKDYQLVAYEPVYMVVLSGSDKDQEAGKLVSFFLDD